MKRGGLAIHAVAQIRNLEALVDTEPGYLWETKGTI